VTTAQEAEGRWVARHQLAVFVVLAFALSWSVWPLVVLNPASSPMVPFGPALAALAVTGLAGGRRAVLDLVRQLTRWRAGPGWYLAALSPLALTPLAGLLAVAAGAPAPAVDLPATVFAVPAVLLTTLVVVGLFEELGWRGYALPRLLRHHRPAAAALILGAIWLLWHLPELVSDPTGQRPVLPFAVTVLAQSVILTWLYGGTRAGLPLVMTFHAAADTAARFVLTAFDGRAHVAVWWSIAALYALVAGVLVRRTAAGLPSAPNG
jgi:CAAX protease family protein